MRRRTHEEYLRFRADEAFRYRGRVITRFSDFTLDVEGRDAVVRGYGGFFVVRFPAKELERPDALRRRGF